MTDRLLDREFASFSAILHGHRIPDQPLVEALMRQAFFAGAATVVGEMVAVRVGDDPDGPLRRIAAELGAHVRAMTAG